MDELNELSAEGEQPNPLLDSTVARLHANPYEALDLSSNASQTDITKAFRSLALKYHPDKSPSPHAAAIFREIKHAQEILGDEASRKAYDRERSGGDKINVNERTRARTRSKPKVRSDEERSDELLTAALALETSRGRNSLQDAPPS